MAEDYDDEEDRGEERRTRRRGQPRFGSFVTIAAAILMLFGAVSRVGKMPEIPALFGIDEAQRRHLQDVRRQTTVITLGSMPNTPSNLHPVNQGSLPMESNPMPPLRPEVDPDEYRGRTSLSTPLPLYNEEYSYLTPRPDPDAFDEGYNTLRPNASGDSLRPNNNGGSQANNSGASGGGTYVVAEGDTWVKIAKRTLGNASRWQELQRANPSAGNGLRVGMRLVVPN